MSLSVSLCLSVSLSLSLFLSLRDPSDENFTVRVIDGDQLMSPSVSLSLSLREKADKAITGYGKGWGRNQENGEKQVNAENKQTNKVQEINIQ